MPYTEKQHRLFEAAAHDPAISAKYHIPQATAGQMASEGIKDAVSGETRKKTLVKYLKGGMT